MYVPVVDAFFGPLNHLERFIEPLLAKKIPPSTSLP